MNAAVTFANCAVGRMPWRKFPLYVLGQFLGSFLASATTYLLFYGECSSWVACLQTLILKYGSIPSWCPVLQDQEQTNKNQET